MSGKYATYADIQKDINKFEARISAFESLTLSGPEDFRIHEMSADLANVSPETYRHKMSLLSGSTRNKGLEALARVMVKLYESIIDKATEFGDPGLVKSMQDVMLPWKREVPVSAADLPKVEAPELPRIDVDDLPDSDDDFDATVEARIAGWKKGKAKRRPRAPSPARTEVAAPSVDEELKDVSPGSGVFPTTSSRILACVYEPAKRAPHKNGKRVKLSDALHMADVEWLEIAGEQFHALIPLSLPALNLYHKEHLISDGVYTILAAKAKDDFEPVASFSFKEGEEKFGRDACAVAMIEYYRAQSIDILNRNKLAMKINFVEKWFERLMDVPSMLPKEACAETFYRFIKRAARSSRPVTEINKTYYGFLMANLACWKAGEAREAMIDRCMRSVRVYWGEYADRYVAAFKDTPDGQFQVRPKYGRVQARVQQLAKDAARRTAAMKSSIANSTAASYAAAVEVVQQESKREATITETLTWKERMQYRFSRVWHLVSNGFTDGSKLYVPTMRDRVFDTGRKVGGFFRRALWRRQDIVVTEDIDGEPVPVVSTIEIKTWFWWSISTPVSALGREVRNSCRIIGAWFNDFESLSTLEPGGLLGRKAPQTE
jgi:hypothetical protein